MAAFTARGIECENRLGYHADSACTGLYLQVTQTNKGGVTRSWVFRYTSPVTKRRREMGLGPTVHQSLPNARKVARECWQQLLSGKDPLEERRRISVASQLARARLITFDQAAQECIVAKKPEWSNAKHAQQWETTLRTYASPIIGNLPVQEIDSSLVLQVLQPIWFSKTETATRVRQRIEAVFDFCKARGQFQGDNPARLEGNIAQLLPKANKVKKVQHHPALSYLRVNEFVAALRKKNGVAPTALEFLILTAARTGEVIGARWAEIDWQARIWTVPAERMKARTAHRVPLNDRAFQILGHLKLTATGDFVFPGWNTKKNEGLSNAAMLNVMRGMPEYQDFTPHGFRSTFRDWCAEMTSYPSEAVEMALAHTIKNRVEAAYRRGDLLDKRIKLMKDWAAFIEITPEKDTEK